jgi:predicted regulator of Ras-like GTPase activity (Roadblock/LC7/MglB family)
MDVLARMNSVPGVIGSMACDPRGRVLAQAFPPAFDLARLQSAATALAERRAGLEAVVGPVGAIDMRFAGARLVVRTVDGIQLLFLCEPTVNLQTLVMSVSGAARSLAALSAGAAGGDAAAAPAEVPPSGGRLFQLVEQIEKVIASTGADRFKVRGRIAFKSGLSLDLIGPETPDDPAKQEQLRAVAAEILGRPL